MRKLIFNLMLLIAISAGVKAVEAKLAGQGRVLLRVSGTEPLIRVMVEGEDEATVKALAQHLADIVKNEIGT